VQHADLTGRNGGGVPAGFHAFSSGLEAVERHAGIGQKVSEDAQSVGAAANACRNRVRQPAVAI